MKHTLCLLLAALLACAAWADEPFRSHRYDIFKSLPPEAGSIVFVGNSITDMHTWAEAFVTSDGQPLPIVNRGNSGTYSTEQSANLESYLVHAPKKLFLMIGTNDIATSGGLDFRPEQVAAHVKSMVQRIHRRCPATKVYLYSILNNRTHNRPAERWLRTNALVKAYVEEVHESWLTYIDLYDALTHVADGGDWSYDRLHLTAAAYRVWAEKICGYLAEGEPFEVRPVYPEAAAALQQNGGLQASHGMRATYFSLLPISPDDVLLFGDAEVKAGEWNEIMGSPHVKNRGSGWGYGALSLEGVGRAIDATFAPTPGVEKASPKAVALYAGTVEVHGRQPLAEVKAHYAALVEKLAAAAPSAKVYLIGVHPTNSAETNSGRIGPLNAFLDSLARSRPERLRYVDGYSDMERDGVALAEYVRHPNYLYALGYNLVARRLAAALEADFPADRYSVASAETCAEHCRQATLRNRVGEAITAGHVAFDLAPATAYTPADLAAFNAQAESAYELLARPSLPEKEVEEMVEALTQCAAKVQ